MTELHQVLAERVAGWRTAGYPHDPFPAIAEILLHARNEHGSSRYLREPQIRALETYWFLRLVEATLACLTCTSVSSHSCPRGCPPLDQPAVKDLVLNEGYAGLVARIGTDDAFVRQHRLEGLRETLNLDYPSWILAGIAPKLKPGAPKAAPVARGAEDIR